MQANSNCNVELRSTNGNLKVSNIYNFQGSFDVIGNSDVSVNGNNIVYTAN